MFFGSKSQKKMENGEQENIRRMKGNRQKKMVISWGRNSTHHMIIINRMELKQK